MKKRNMIWIIVLSLVIVVCGVMLAGILCSQRLEVTNYDIALPGVQNDVKMVFLSDLHCLEFGKDNKELVELIEAQQPELIVLDGDLVSRGSKDEAVARVCDFIARVREIAPTYFALGNHEMDYIAEHGTALLDRISASGVSVLECAYEDLTVNGTAFRLGGMSQLAYTGGDGKYDPAAEAFLNEYCDTPLPKVLLSHRPEAFGFKNACRDWDVDLILSGHTHGGLVRLPLIGGLVAPIQGFFPKIYYGEYVFYQTKMIATSGLAGHGWVPRMFNPPEICVVTLTKEG